MSKSFAHVAKAAALILALSHPAIAQVSLQTTPPPTVTAENEAWYLSGEPVTFGGSVYYPAGAITHFQRNEMVRTGTVGAVPIYVRTTQEVGSVIYVPLAGGVMKPYERRRSGELAGTVGSSAPSFPVALPSEGAPQQYVGAPVLESVPVPVGPTGYVPANAVTPVAAPSAVPDAVGTSGVMTATPARTRIQTAQRPVGLNTVFVDFQDVRWFAAGPTVEFTPARFTRVGEHRGFDVYQENGQAGTIYLALVDGAPGLLAPYKRR
jgi:hypothetical protein